MTGQQEWTEHIVAEIDVLAHDAKLGTEHEFHDGWRFELDTAHRFEDRAPVRVLTCGCGVVLVSAPVTGPAPVSGGACRVVFYPADGQPDGMPAIPQVLGGYPHRSQAESALDDARARQTRRGQWRIEPV
ncbi:hypothetical protein SEA_RIBEYE_61 [Gordonia phage Ribeye]|uniref:Uncharacterized protein n=1 Tax=Gordonia phage Ribeye TaxID=2250417 RepID=A0A345KPH2_9CAUD|nr:hypothetical protein J1768_gp61 [Gordonia phage Ribeye]AXH44924.1 hypothetical protein SEA_RIBEYE_61 [Gordonia phage Ribeye]